MSATTRAPGPTDEDTAPAPSRPSPPRRSRLSRLSAGHAVMLLAGLVAAVANFAVLRGHSDRVEVLVAGVDLRAGQTVTADQLETRAVALEGAVLEALLTPAELTGGEVVATAPVAAGSPVRDGDLRAAAAADGQRRMSLPVDPARAAGGRIAVGDRIDVIRTVDGRSGYVVSGAPVLEVRDPDGPATLGGSGTLALTIAVDAGAALCLAGAIEDGALDVLVSTGRDPVPATGCGAGTPDAPGAASPPVADAGSGP